MNCLNNFDYSLIAVYLVIIIGLCVYLKRKASASLEDYFLGGRGLPWWALGISGMASFVDITGTMLITSFLFMLGPRGLFIELRGGVAIFLPLVLLWAGKWHRRSKCMTGGEHNIFRFGHSPSAQIARVIAALATVIMVVGQMAYLAKGEGLFLSMFLPYTPFQCSFAMLAIVTVYTMISGFYGVVFTDIFQSVIILVAVIIISVMAVIKIGMNGDFASIATTLSGNPEWMKSSLSWNVHVPPGTEYEMYRCLGMYAFFYLLKNVLIGFGAGGESRYFGSKNDRDAGLLTFMWIWLMTFRWPLMMSFAVLGMYFIKATIPNQAVLVQAAELMKQYLGQIEPARWTETISQIIHHPVNFPAELIEGLKTILGHGWGNKLLLVGQSGHINPERILPAVILDYMPGGLRGLFLVALIAAGMSTSNQQINWATGFMTRDIYQRYIRPTAKNNELIKMSWLFCVLIAFGAYFLATKAKSINDIWGWIMMGLQSGLLVPAVIRFYWWRFNAMGVIVGTVVGMTTAIIQRAVYPEMSEIYQFLLVLSTGSVGSIIGTFLGPPADRKVLEQFYKVTKPFGFWGPFKDTLSSETRAAMKREHRNDLSAVPFALMWQITLFMLPMQLIIRAYKSAVITGAIFAICLGAMYFIWYRNLPKDNFYPEDEIGPRDYSKASTEAEG